MQALLHTKQWASQGVHWSPSKSSINMYVAFVATSNASQSENKAEGKEKNELNLFLTTRLGRLAGLLLHFSHRWRIKKERKLSNSRWKKISQQFQLKTPEQRLVWFALLFTFFSISFHRKRKVASTEKKAFHSRATGANKTNGTKARENKWQTKSFEMIAK